MITEFLFTYSSETDVSEEVEELLISTLMESGLVDSAIFQKKLKSCVALSQEEVYMLLKGE